MKRKGGFYEKLCTEDNIELADELARINKRSSKKHIMLHDLKREEDNKKLLESFKNLTYKTSKYDIFTIYEPKERLIYRLSYYPDRIAHHAIMNVVKQYWTSLFITNTYSCIEGRGIGKCAKDLYRVLRKTKDNDATKWCLKLDIRKFYPNINHKKLKEILRWKIKDNKFLTILDEIIDSVNYCSNTPGVGVPIGNYLSQFFANLYLTKFDHWLKEIIKVKYYFRYADDIVILGNNKQYLWNVFNLLQKYLNEELLLQIKPNYQIFEVEKRGIDFVGLIFYHTHKLLRKSIKSKIRKLIYKFLTNKIDKSEFKNKFYSYYGWLRMCNSKNFLKSIKNKTNMHYSNFNGILTNAKRLNNNFIVMSTEERKKYYLFGVIHNKKPYLLKKWKRKLR